MQKLIAVKVTDVGDDVRIEGFLSRGKNRKCCWTIYQEGRTIDQVLAVVQELEENRLQVAEVQGELT